MPTMGEVLKDARHRLGLSLEQAEADTKVRKKYLAALEADDYAELPAPVYARGFLQVYAEYLGIDPAFAGKLYLQPSGAASSLPLRPAASGFRPESPISMGTILSIVFVGLAIAAIFYLYSQYLSFASAPAVTAVHSPTEIPTSVVRATPAAIVLPTSVPVPTATAVPPTATPTPVFGVEVQVVISERCWLRVSADGQSQALFEGVLEAGDKMTWKAKDRIDMRVGNAGGVEVSMNGMRQGKLGASGEVKNLTWGRQ